MFDRNIPTGYEQKKCTQVNRGEFGTGRYLLVFTKKRKINSKVRKKNEKGQQYVTKYIRRNNWSISFAKHCYFGKLCT